MRIQRLIILSLLLILPLTLGACRTTREDRVMIGTVAGAGVGAAIGGVPGAVAGGLGGGALGLLSE